jgi:hypothetical protein
MRRDQNSISGWVNFPTKDQDYEHTNEGGMCVRLVVIDSKVEKAWEINQVNHDKLTPKEKWELEDQTKKLEQEKFMRCCGGWNRFIYDETFIGDDVHPTRTYNEIGNEVDPATDFHFPFLKKRHLDYRPRAKAAGPKMEAENFISTDYLAVLTIGSTGWSGFNKNKGEYFICKYDDLTEQGKSLYDSIKKLYPQGTIYLQTWLDT